jgi:hypothetical protein
MVDFGLTYRMKNRNLLEELRGRVSSGTSGGSRWRVEQYLYSGPPQHGYAFELLDSYKKNNMLCVDNTLCTNAVNHIDNWKHNWLSNKCVTHEVIAVDTTNKYAIIQHNLYQASICDVCHSTHVSSLSYPNQDEIYYNPTYFLCGINDYDKLYFLHPISSVPEGLIIRAKSHDDVMSVVKWCNKEDLGFEGRIQGDIIYAEIEPRLSKIIVDKDYIDEVIYDFTVGKKKMFIRINLKKCLKEKFRANNWPQDLKNLIDYMKYLFPQEYKKKHLKHELFTDGIIARISVGKLPGKGDKWSLVDLFNTYVILGSEFVICHPEHPPVKIQIPPDKALLISAQR